MKPPTTSPVIYPGSMYSKADDLLLRKHAKFDLDTARYAEDPMGWGDRPEEKVLFLDIDGVMVGNKQWHAACNGLSFSPFNVSSHRPAMERCGFDPDAVDELKRILKITGARLVIHSDWAIDLESADLLWQKMLAHGFTQDAFHPEWCLPLMRARLSQRHGIDLHHPTWGMNGDRDMRPFRIPAWLSWHSPAAFAILDDLFVESWIQLGAETFPKLPRYAPASYKGGNPQANHKWVRVGDQTTGRDVLSSHEADLAINLL